MRSSLCLMRWNRQVTLDAFRTALELRINPLHRVSVATFGITSLDPYYFHQTSIDPRDQLLVTSTVGVWLPHPRDLSKFEFDVTDCLVNVLSSSNDRIQRGGLPAGRCIQMSRQSPFREYTCCIQLALVNTSSPDSRAMAIAHWNEKTQGRHLRSKTVKYLVV
ncbi:Hypothetical protein, putative [Bodo saltans]|uniref:Uncharacterized protein n=1 Tax=Bodo saltans TaxID=75058 RepID=A0A0S4JVV8_BODSA|nr:Hypothetical protein, putative [Bodo saltans]|eukprot:CUG93545.1 Hypothetical protein, putative [Bodo saltans]